MTTAAVSDEEVEEAREERSTMDRTITDNREDTAEVDRTITAVDVERDATMAVRRKDLVEDRTITDSKEDTVEEDSKTTARKIITVVDVEKVITDARRENMVLASRATREATGVDSNMEVDSRAATEADNKVAMEVEAIFLREESKFDAQIKTMHRS